MSKKFDVIELQVYRKKDEAINCFLDVLKKATKRVDHVDEELKKHSREVMKKSIIDTKNFEEGFKESAEKVVAIPEEKLADLVNELAIHVAFIQKSLDIAEANATEMYKTGRDAKNQINQIEHETLELIRNIWSSSREFMEQRCGTSQDIISVRSGFIEKIIAMAEVKIDEMKEPLLRLVERLLKEHEKEVHDFKIQLDEEVKKITEIIEVERAKYEEFAELLEKQKQEEERLLEEQRLAEEAKKAAEEAD